MNSNFICLFVHLNQLSSGNINVLGEHFSQIQVSQIQVFSMFVKGPSHSVYQLWLRSCLLVCGMKTPSSDLKIKYVHESCCFQLLVDNASQNLLEYSPIPLFECKLELYHPLILTISKAEARFNLFRIHKCSNTASFKDRCA